MPPRRRRPASRRPAARGSGRSAARGTGPRSSGARRTPPDSRSAAVPPVPEGPGLRRGVERRSAPVLVVLRRQPRWVLALAVLAVAAVGVFAPPLVGGLALLAVAAFLTWLTFLAWPLLVGPGRTLRITTLVVVTVAAVARLLEL